MEQVKVIEQELFTLKECAKIVGISEKAMYMHYYRGHIQRYESPAHKLYFTRQELKSFCYKYVYNIVSLF